MLRLSLKLAQSAISANATICESSTPRIGKGRIVGLEVVVALPYSRVLQTEVYARRRSLPALMKRAKRCGSSLTRAPLGRNGARARQSARGEALRSSFRVGTAAMKWLLFAGGFIRVKRSVTTPPWREACTGRGLYMADGYINARRIGALATLTIELGAFAAFVQSRATLAGFPLDDAWIHQVVARTFARTGTLGYVPGRFGSGSTSYLWAVLLSPNYLIFHVNPVYYSLVLNTVFWLATGQVLYRLLLGGRGDAAGGGTRLPSAFEPVRAALTAGLACAGGNVMWLAFSGMEATLAIALSVGAIAAFASALGPIRSASSSAPSTATRRGLTAGALLWALVLTRPEMAVIGVLLLLWVGGAAWAQGRLSRTRVAPVGLALAGLMMGVGTYALVNLIGTGQAFPQTLAGRKWMWLADDNGRTHAAIAADVPVQWLNRLRDYTLGTSSAWVFWAFFGAALVGVHVLVRERKASVLAICALALLHVALFLVLMPAMGHGGRYQPLVPLVFSVLAIYGMLTAAHGICHFALLRLRRSRRAIGTALVVGVFALPGVIFTGAGIWKWREAEPLAVLHINRTEVALAAVFAELPKDAVIASFDIGAAGFFSERQLIDLGGLTDPSVVPYLKERHAYLYLKERHVDYVALPLGYDPDDPDVFNFGYRLHLFDNPDVQAERVAILSSPFEVWFPGIASTMHSAPQQGVYHLTFADPPTLGSALGGGPDGTWPGQKRCAPPEPANRDLLRSGLWGFPFALALLGFYALLGRGIASRMRSRAVTGIA